MYFSALLFLAQGQRAIESVSAIPTHPLSFMVSLPVPSITDTHADAWSPHAAGCSLLAFIPRHDTRLALVWRFCFAILRASRRSLTRVTNRCFALLAAKELPCSALAPSLQPCFSRPERPAKRRPPSRWASHSPTASQSQSTGDLASSEERGSEELLAETPSQGGEPAWLRAGTGRATARLRQVARQPSLPRRREAHLERSKNVLRHSCWMCNLGNKRCF